MNLSKIGMFIGGTVFVTAGIAVDTGAAIARQVADITVSSESLNEIVILKQISNALMKRIQSNYRFIVGFNSALIALGLMGMISPASSALLHNGSTILTGVKSTTTLLKKNEETGNVYRN